MSDFSALPLPPKGYNWRKIYEPSAEMILEQPWRFVQPTGVGRFVQDAAMIAGAPGRTIVDLLGHTAIGAARLFGADIEPMNVTTQAQAYLRKISGQAAGMTQDEVYRAEMAREQSAHNQMGLVSKSLHNAGEMFGWVAGTFGMPGGTSRLFLGSGAAVNQKLTSFNKWLLDAVRLRQAPKWLPKAAALGQLESIRALGSGQGGGLVFDQDAPEGWRALETGVMAGAMYPVFEFMGRLGRAAAARTLLKGSGKDYEAFRKWAEKNTTMLGTEAPEQYMARSIEGWVSAGSPGASNRTLTKLLATAEQSAIEGLGYSALDVEWWKLAAEAILDQDWKKGEEWLAKTLGNMLGVAAIHAGGKLTEVMPWQRRQPSVEQVIQEAKGKELPTEKMPPRDLKPGEPVPEEKSQPKVPVGIPGWLRQSMEAEGIAPDRLLNDIDFSRPEVQEALRRDPVVQAIEKSNPELAARIRANKAGAAEIRAEVAKLTQKDGQQAAPVLDPNLSRLGWVAGEGKVTLGQKSPYSFEVSEGKAVPSVRLKEVLGIKEPVELQAFQRILEFASLNNALAAKANLGGRPVSVEGVHGVEGISKGKEGKLYTFRFNEVLERPLSPEGDWKRVKEYPARAPDEVSAEQGQAADAVAEWRMRRQDLTPEVEALADRVIKVLRTVAAEKDPGVAETLQVFPEVMERMQQNPEQGIRDLAHLLTSKSPEIWSQELQKQQEQQEQDQQTERPVSVGATQAGHAAEVLRVHEQGVPERRSLQKKMAEVARGGKRTEVPVTEREAQQMSEVVRYVEAAQEPVVQQREANYLYPADSYGQALDLTQRNPSWGGKEKPLSKEQAQRRLQAQLNQAERLPKEMQLLDRVVSREASVQGLTETQQKAQAELFMRLPPLFQRLLWISEGGRKWAQTVKPRLLDKLTGLITGMKPDPMREGLILSAGDWGWTPGDVKAVADLAKAIAGRAGQDAGKVPMQLESRKQSLRDLVAKMQKPKAHQQPLEVFTSGMEGVEKARGAKAHKEAVLKAIKAGEVVNPEVLKDYPELGQAQAFGGLLPPQVGRVLETLFWKAVEGTKQILGPFIRTEWTPIVERVRSLGEGPLADRAWKVITAFKNLRASVQNQWADFAESINPKGGGLHTAKELGERISHPDFADKYYWTKWHAHSDEKAGRFLNVEIADLSPEAQKAVLDGHAIFYEVGLALQEAGAVVRNIPGEQGEATRFTADPNRWRMVRRMTPMMMEAARQKTGPLYNAYVEMISDLLKIDISEAQKKAAAMLDRALVSHDAAEFARAFELMPDAIRLKDGTLVEILEAHPYEQVRAMMEHGLLRAAYGKEFGWEVAEDGMPSPEIAQSVRQQARGAVEDLIRALNGVPVNDPIPFLQPGTALYDMHNFWRGWLHVWRAAKMSLSAVANLGEVTGAAPTFLGAGRVAKSTAEAVQVLADGRMHDVIRELVDEGIFTRDILNYTVTGAGSEKVRRRAQVIEQAATLPFRGVQEYFVEFPIALAIRDAHRAMLTGEAAGSLPLRSMLEGMGFERATAEAMLKGQAEPADYDRFKLNAIHYLAGGTTGTTAEKVLNSQRNVLKNAIMFADFFRARSNQLRGLTAQMGKAVKAGDKQGIKDSTLMMLRFMGFSGLSGGITSSLMAALDDGLDGVAQMWHEMALDPVYGMRMVVLSSFLGGIGGSIINELLQGDSDEGMVERMVKAVPMYDAVTEPGEFLVSFTPLASSENQYAGMDLLEKTGAFARQITPAYRRAHEGLFGISAIALSKEDPKVDAAQDSWWRWWRDNVGFEGGSGDKNAEQKEFRVSMREVSRLLKEGQRDGPAIMQALVTAAKAKGWDSVASSLRRRKFFDVSFNGLERDQQKALLEWIGPDKARLLRRYDAVVDVLIEWVNDRR